MRKLKIYLYKNYHSFFWFSSNCCVLKRDYVRQKLILSLISFTPNLSLLEKDMLAKIVNLWQNCLLFFIRKLPWLGKVIFSHLSQNIREIVIISCFKLSKKLALLWEVVFSLISPNMLARNCLFKHKFLYLRKKTSYMDKNCHPLFVKAVGRGNTYKSVTELKSILILQIQMCIEQTNLKTIRVPKFLSYWNI